MKVSKDSRKHEQVSYSFQGLTLDCAVVLIIKQIGKVLHCEIRNALISRQRVVSVNHLHDLSFTFDPSFPRAADKRHSLVRSIIGSRKPTLSISDRYLNPGLTVIDCQVYCERDAGGRQQHGGRVGNLRGIIPLSRADMYLMSPPIRSNMSVTLDKVGNARKGSVCVFTIFKYRFTQDCGAVGPDMSDYEDAIESLDDATLGLRHRSLWDPDRDSLGSEIVPGLREVSQLLDDDDSSVLTEGDDGVGCPLPSTPEDEHLLDCELS
uniref:Uncharacterized protein n=1 Tax=Timema monikensis TaxID=170555 RepID=A0A7R9HQH3_9NEOP|nr:unnamed protein product [Timema monikensis]